jgi:hypothetical protein
MPSAAADIPRSPSAPPRLRGHILLLTITLASCKDAPGPGPLTLAEFHSGAQEMALDGFQFGKGELGWPFDSGAPTTAAYLELLEKNNRLQPATAERLARISIANLSDSDPGETAFASLPAEGGILVIRKDGQSRTFPNLDASASFAPPPPRTPAWLP